MNDREVMRQALDALLRAGLGGTIQMNQRAIDSAVGILRAALVQAEPVQVEPVAESLHAGLTDFAMRAWKMGYEVAKAEQAESLVLTVAQQLRQLADKFDGEWNVSDIEMLSMAAYILEKAEPVVEPHKPATAPADGQFMSGNPSY